MTDPFPPTPPAADDPTAFPPPPGVQPSVEGGSPAVGAANTPTEQVPAFAATPHDTPTEQVPAYVPAPHDAPTQPVPQFAPAPPPDLAAAAPAAHVRSGRGKRLAVLAGVGVAAAALGVGGGYLARGGEVDDLTAERDGLVVERDGLVDERDGLTAERDGLDADLEAATAENAELEGDIETAKEELQTLRDETGVCIDALHTSDEIALQWGELFALQLEWMATDIDSPEEAEIEDEIDAAFDELDEMTATYVDYADDCEDAFD